tara:strand:- start:181 stop:306 length:126 start_codon:yes stop_codon:yes gene_type:complete
MELNSKKETRHHRIENALKSNLKKRKTFQNTIKKTNKEKKK